MYCVADRSCCRRHHQKVQKDQTTRLILSPNPHGNRGKLVNQLCLVITPKGAHLLIYSFTHSFIHLFIYLFI